MILHVLYEYEYVVAKGRHRSTASTYYTQYEAAIVLQVPDVARSRHPQLNTRARVITIVLRIDQSPTSSIGTRYNTMLCTYTTGILVPVRITQVYVSGNTGMCVRERVAVLLVRQAVIRT